jgi:hypothetical protein
MSATSPAAAAGGLNAIHTFVFDADSGDTWGGWFIGIAGAFVAGTRLQTPHGAYTVLAQTTEGFDVSLLGLQAGQVFVEWYRDGAGAVFLPTRLGPSVPAGTTGLGSELDTAWNGLAWDDFGFGGLLQAEAAAATRSAFTWRFTAQGGDRWEGVVYAASNALVPGVSVATPHGSYMVLGARSLDADEEAIVAGTVRLTGSYFDAGSGSTLAVRDAGLEVDAGVSGLGSEIGAAWDGRRWVAFGEGGRSQANLTRDSSYSWHFHDPARNDWYSGWVIAETGTYAVGSVIPHPSGFYAITGESQFGRPSGHADGATWISGFYDGGSGQWLPTESWSAGAPRPLVTRGLGNEWDRAWDGDGWDAFSAQSTAGVVVERDSSYSWHFHDPVRNDWYAGWIIEPTGTYAVGSVIPHPNGSYVITGESQFGRASGHAAGTTWINGFYDGGSGQWLPTESWSAGAPRPLVTRGLGNEWDRAWDGDGWDAFSAQSTAGVVVESDSLFLWYFVASGTGDMWNGRLSADSSAYDAGAWFNTAFGTYVIYEERRLGRDSGIADGTVWMQSYFDAQSARWVSAHFGAAEQAATTAGLGSEVDWIEDRGRWYPVGGGGWFQVDLPL